MIDYLIGVDDTDNLVGPGTGNRVRKLAALLQDDRVATPVGITRHQLLISPEIPYTSHNSSACLLVRVDDRVTQGELERYCCNFLQQESAAEADTGLCLVEWCAIDEEIVNFGKLAKVEVLKSSSAYQLAQVRSIYLAGLVGSGNGIIGALAAVGLRYSGNDGRFLWLPGLRELAGVYTVAELCNNAHINRVQDMSGKSIPDSERIEVGEWVRPILKNNLAVLFVEEVNHGWRVINKEQIKAISG